MRTFGMALLVAGLLGIVVSISMDTSVATDDLSRRVHNLGLMRDQQNLLFISIAGGVIGALLVAFAGGSARTSQLGLSENRKCPFCAESIKKEATICRYCGKEVTNELNHLDSEVQAAVSRLQTHAFSVQRLEGQKWIVSKESKQILHYPNSHIELIAVAEKEAAEINFYGEKLK